MLGCLLYSDLFVGDWHFCCAKKPVPVRFGGLASSWTRSGQKCLSLEWIWLGIKVFKGQALAFGKSLSPRYSEI